MAGWRFRLATRTVSVLVALAALLCAARIARRNYAQVTGSTQTVFSPEMREQLRIVQSKLPAGAAVLYFAAEPEPWYSRLWQRALYPKYRTVVVQPWDQPRIAELRARYGARFALSAGKPPFDPGYLWKIDLGAVPGLKGVTWFGELNP